MALPEWLLAKKFTGRVNRILELYLPPALVDRKWVACLFNGLQGRGFKYYDVTKDPVDFPRCLRDSDCTNAMLEEAMGYIVGSRVLDIGCGSGRVLKILADKGIESVGIDPNQTSAEGENWQILHGFVEDFPFPEKSFDTVLSFKTLEHIPDPKATLRSWKNLARRRIILVVPCQRYRRYVYDGHINFFPDEFQLRTQLGLSENATVKKIDYDWLIYEEILGPVEKIG